MQPLMLNMISKGISSVIRRKISKILQGTHKVNQAPDKPKLFIACNMRPCRPRSIPATGYVLGIVGDTQWIHS